MSTSISSVEFSQARVFLTKHFNLIKRVKSNSQYLMGTLHFYLISWNSGGIMLASSCKLNGLAGLSGPICAGANRLYSNHDTSESLVSLRVVRINYSKITQTSYNFNETIVDSFGNWIGSIWKHLNNQWIYMEISTAIVTSE